MFAKLVAKPGLRQELLDALLGLLPTVDEEDGTELYLIHLVDSEPDAIRVYELYRDTDALAVHGGSDTMTSVFPQLARLLDGTPEMVVAEPYAGKGVDLS